MGTTHVNQLPDIMTASEVAFFLGCTVSTLEQLHREKRLCGVRLGTGGLRYTRESLLRQLDALSTETPPYQIPADAVAVAQPVNTRRAPPRLVPMMEAQP